MMMRRLFVTALAVPALLLSACGGSDDPEVLEPSPTSVATTSDDAVTTTDTATTTTEDDATTTTDDATTTTDDETTTTDDEATTSTETSAAGDDGGPEGQAAADRAKEWLVAFVSGEETVCDYMLDLSSDGPMKDSEADYELCTSYVPSLAGDMFDAEVAGIIGSMEITGATVDGDTATVDRSNFSEMFAEGFGDDVIALKRIDGEWYVDLEQSFQSPTE